MNTKEKEIREKRKYLPYLTKLIDGLFIVFAYHTFVNYNEIALWLFWTMYLIGSIITLLGIASFSSKESIADMLERNLKITQSPSFYLSTLLVDIISSAILYHLGQPWLAVAWLSLNVVASYYLYSFDKRVISYRKITGLEYGQTRVR